MDPITTRRLALIQLSDSWGELKKEMCMDDLFWVYFAGNNS